MARSPMTKQRSPWQHLELPPVARELMGPTVVGFARSVHDGRLVAYVAEEPAGLHLSISHRRPDGSLSRYPTWDEIAHARDELLPSNVAFVMHLPVAAEYVALHDTTFHLHEHPERGA